MNAGAAALTPTVLIDRVWARPSDRTAAMLRTGALVLGFALLTAALAQWEIHLGFTPVPITGQTLGVLLAGGTLGWRAGAASQLLYWVLGLVPFFHFYSGGTHGWKVATGATFGYFVGFVVAAGLIGRLAERRQDRTLTTSLAAMALGSVVIYVFGAGWLAHSVGVPVANGDVNAISLGVTPFLIGDLIKLGLAGALLPLSWRLLGTGAKDSQHD